MDDARSSREGEDGEQEPDHGLHRPQGPPSAHGRNGKRPEAAVDLFKAAIDARTYWLEPLKFCFRGRLRVLVHILVSLNVGRFRVKQSPAGIFVPNEECKTLFTFLLLSISRCSNAEKVILSQ